MRTLMIYFASLIIAFQVNGQDLQEEIKEICKSVNKAETEEAFSRFAELEDMPTEVMPYISYFYLKYYLQGPERLIIADGNNKRVVEEKIKMIENSLDTIKEITTMFEALPKGGFFSGLFRKNSKRKLSKYCSCIDKKGESFTELFKQYSDTLQKLRQITEIGNTTNLIEFENDSIRQIFSQYEDELKDLDETVEKYKIMMGEELEQLAQESAALIMETSGEEETQDSASLEFTVHDVDSIEFEVYLTSKSVEIPVQENISESEIISEEEVPGGAEPSFEPIEAETEKNLDLAEVSIDENIAEPIKIVSEEYTSDTMMVLAPEITSDTQVIPVNEEISEPEDVAAEEFISGTIAMISEYAMDLKVEGTSRLTEVINQKNSPSEMLLSQEQAVAEYCNTKVNSLVESSTFEILKKWLKVMEGDTLEISIITIGEADDTWRNKGVKHTFVELKGCRGIGKEIGLKNGDKISNKTIALLRMLSAEMYVRKGIENTLSMLEKGPYVKVRSSRGSYKDWMEEEGKQSGSEFRKKVVILKCHTCR